MHLIACVWYRMDKIHLSAKEKMNRKYERRFDSFTDIEQRVLLAYHRSFDALHHTCNVVRYASTGPKTACVIIQHKGALTIAKLVILQEALACACEINATALGFVTFTIWPYLKESQGFFLPGVWGDKESIPTVIQCKDID